MRKLLLRTTVAIVTLTIGLILGYAVKYLRPAHKSILQPAPCPTPSPTTAVQVSFADSADDDEYPDTSPLAPWDIANFIDNHPQARLERLWKRLGVKGNSDDPWDFSECGDCRTEMNDYDLDDEAGDETLLKISDGSAESFRYLVFKRQGDRDDWKLLGHVDAWGKYRNSEALVLLGGGQSWLVILGQSASGSGVAYYNRQVFEVTRNRLNHVVTYESEGFQNGYDGWPIKGFTSRILSCENDHGRRTVTVEFNIDYSHWTSDDKELPLFSKRQIAVFVQTAKGAAVLDAQRSTVTKHELDHIYRIDSMTGSDFLKYNYRELLNLATRGNRAQKEWLETYLKTCDNSAEKRQLLAALAK